jgi:hypothetical protein
MSNVTKLQLDKSKITKAYSIFNPRLMKSFELTRENIKRKHEDSEGLFKKEDWRYLEDFDLKKGYLNYLSNLISQFRSEMNDGSKVF